MAHENPMVKMAPDMPPEDLGDGAGEMVEIPRQVVEDIIASLETLKVALEGVEAPVVAGEVPVLGDVKPEGLDGLGAEIDGMRKGFGR